MKCHYEVLDVARDANSDDIKKAYKKMAIKWHPDKNLDNTGVATEQFQLIQQAFDVLSDSHERAWYDDHRDAILKGKVSGDGEDDSLDVYQYFTVSCYKGYGDDEKGFYSVYREVFNKIAAEDSEYYADSDSDFEIPSFGKSNSPYEEVKLFYAHWQSYCTKKSYSWLDPYDSRTAENRKISRLIDKENKKTRDKARKARNEEVRELVNFVRKRDKRIQAHAEHMQKVNAEKAFKAEEKRLERILERKKEVESHKESEWSKFSNLESELKDIEAKLASEFGESLSETSSDSQIDDQLYCIACNKLFKTSKAFANHESSKKHKENILVLKESMLEGSDIEDETEDESGAEEGEVSFEYDGALTDELEDDPLFCGACDKQFKTTKAIQDHKKTDKHLRNYKIYKEAMGDILCDEDVPEDSKSIYDWIDPNREPDRLFKPFLRNDEASNKPFDGPTIEQRLCKQVDEFSKDNDVIKGKVDKICKEWDELFNTAESLNSDEESDFASTLSDVPLKSESKKPKTYPSFIQESDEDNSDFFGIRKKNQKKKQKTKTKFQPIKKKLNKIISVEVTESDSLHLDEKESETSSVSQDSTINTRSAVSNGKLSLKKKNKSKKPSQVDANDDTNNTCAVCNETFPSKNKLFLHLSKTGHSIYIGDKEKVVSKNKDDDSVGNLKKKSKNRKK